ncbi:fibronectin type III domain-containing protein [Eubacterium ventriosum]|uniref:fibronectin type III domain-containing protein n=1 Tax=Eubacterium ventriosum TaxID=39496 RepID=UPI003999BF55
MRKVFNKALAGVTSATLIATLALGVNFTNTVKADEAKSADTVWSFTQGGQYNPDEPGNTGYIKSVNVGNDVLSNWGRDKNEKQTQTASKATTGFTLNIENTGWDAGWNNNPVDINPWAVEASNTIEAKAGHIYKVSFKAKASKKKYGYVAFGTDIVTNAATGATLTPYDQAPIEMSDDATNQIITLGTTDKTYTFTFTNWVSAKKIKTSIMLGAFNSQYDYAGNSVSDIITEKEVNWSGTVVVSDFTITDEGLNKEFVVEPPKPTQPSQPSQPSQPTTKPSVTPGNNNGGNNQPAVTKPAAKKLARVAKVKAKNNKAKTVKVTWRKVANAKKYEVKVGNKTYTAKKATLTVKKLKKGKTYKIKVRAKATGFKTGAWSKTVKVKIKK